MKYSVPKKRVRSQKGIAVVFVLGILGLLTVIGLGFAASALLDKQISGTNANTERAKLLARSGFERAFALLRAGAAPETIVSWDNAQRPSAGVGDGVARGKEKDGEDKDKSSKDFDFLWRLNSVVDGIDIFSLGDSYDNTSETSPVWQYVRVRANSDDPAPDNPEIIGRIAYVVESNEGRLDPSVHLGNNVGIFLTYGYFGTLPALSRFGTSEWELNFRNALEGSTSTLSNSQFRRLLRYLYNETADTSSSPAVPHFNNPSRFHDLAALIAEAKKAGGSVGEADLSKHLEFVQAPAMEAFWIDKNKDTEISSEEFFHRFNLARIDWDNSYFDDVNLLFGFEKNGEGGYERIKPLNKDEAAEEKEEVADGQKKEEYGLYNARPSREEPDLYKGQDSDTNMCLDTGGIQWLGRWRPNPATLPTSWGNDNGNFEEEDDAAAVKRDYSLRRKQVAANIIQYCRKDTSPTVTNLTVADWVAEGAEPLYAGVGKHPLINEAAIKASVVGAVVETPGATPGADSTYNWKYEVTLSFGTELIDIYNIADLYTSVFFRPRPKAEVYFFGSFECRYYDLSEGSYKSCSLPINATNGKVIIDPAASPSPWGSNGYTTKESFWHQVAGIVPLEGSFSGAAGKENEHKANVKLQKVTLKIEKVYLKYQDSEGTLRDRDFSKIGKTFKVVTPEEVAVSEQKYFYGAAATEDPRVNHYPDDWIPIRKVSDDPTVDDWGVGVLEKDPVTNEEYYAIPAVTNFVTLAYPDPSSSPSRPTPGSRNLTLDLSSGGTRDKEAATDPALGTLSTAFIAEKPMLSLWELGAISRAEKWRTINLKRTVPNPNAEKKDTSGGKNNRMGFDKEKAEDVEDENKTHYGDGDGNILDQVKINEVVASSPSNSNTDKTKVERTGTFGKVNINSSVHNVLRAIFQDVKFNTDITRHFRYDRANSDSGSAFYSLSCTGASPSPETCVACAVKAKEHITGTKRQYKTRADLLLPMPGTDPDNTSVMDRFRISGTAEGANDAQQEQIAGKVMNLLKAETVDQAYVIVVAQTIKEARKAHNQTMYVDWNRDGSYSTITIPDSLRGVDRDTDRGNGTNIMAVKTAGYLRTPMMSELTVTPKLYGKRFGKTPKELNETVTKIAGTYCNGVDRITATVKLLVLLEKDTSGKWKIRRYEYVD
ncbi:MAG: hypothetical protein J6A21_08705 [Lentisphaeria bacterium]|nr:hypothetical protein [Lentisphaeria bacterium]